jgi:hypothetical protein
MTESDFFRKNDYDTRVPSFQQMKCQVCGSVTDWLGAESNWERVNKGSDAVMGLYECCICGYRQYAR